ncbi:MAG: hypothetical protein NZ455_08320 [Bacteroidia bacterium]|nr:hypothetical protein [Bacteroidia bacterium]
MRRILGYFFCLLFTQSDFQTLSFNFLGVSLWAFRLRSCPQGRRATG